MKHKKKENMVKACTRMLRYASRSIGQRVVACAINMTLVFGWCAAASGAGDLEGKVFHHDLFSVSFPNETHGWASGSYGTVLHTSNGGTTWCRQDSVTPYPLASICFIDEHNGWAVGDQGTIIHTQDGGETWVKQEAPVRFFLMDVCFLNALKGFIVTERTHILSTEDGGKTWAVIFSDEDYILKSVSFCDASHGWSVGEYGFIYHTQDGGSTWEKQAGYFGLDPMTSEPVGGIYLFDVKAVTPQTAWAVGIDGYVTRTTNGGTTWTEVPAGAPKTHLFCIETGDDGAILVGGKGVLFRYSEEEDSFGCQQFEPPVTYGWLYGICRRGTQGFAAAGWEGNIYFSGVGGWHSAVR